MSMQSLAELYRIGAGPSSSHTMAPRIACERFVKKHTQATSYRATLYGSLAATGQGHLTDIAITSACSAAAHTKDVEIVWKMDCELPLHPNGMRFEALDDSGACIAAEIQYSVGGGALMDEEGQRDGSDAVYPQRNFAEVLAWCAAEDTDIRGYVEHYDNEAYSQHLPAVWQQMKHSVNRGLAQTGVLPGALQLGRKAGVIYVRLGRQVDTIAQRLQRTGFISAYTYAVSEENASAGIIVTAPSCGACGVVPGLLRYLQETQSYSDQQIHQALAVAGVIGNVTKSNASISGAEVGCQGEVGTACAMAAAAACYLAGGSSQHIGYAAEMGLEHHLGLTCDPVMGLVQIPCIERNAVAACRAHDVAELALLHGEHRVSFDDVVEVMAETGRDLQDLYRETSRGGLAKQLFDRIVDTGRNVCD